MRTQTISQSAVGVTPWIPLNYRQSPFCVSAAVDFDATGAMTYTVEHTFDDLGDFRQVASISRVGTAVTITFLAPHDLSTNDTVFVSASGVSGMDGSYTATVVSPTVVTYVSAVSATSTGGGNTLVTRIRPFPKANLTAKTVTAEDVYIAPITAIRLNVSLYTAGKATLIVNQGSNS